MSAADDKSRVQSTKVQSVLFVCGYNAIRSPMAEGLARHYFGKSAYIQSAGVRKGEPDGFMSAVMEEIGIDASRHKARTLDELEEWEGLNFDLINHPHAGGPPRGPRTHPYHRGGCRILAHTRPFPRTRLARAAPRRLS